MTIEDSFSFEFSNQLACTLLVTATDGRNIATGTDTPTPITAGSSVAFEFTLQSPQNAGELIFAIATEVADSSSQAGQLGFTINAGDSGGYTFELMTVTALLINVLNADPIPASLSGMSFASPSNKLYVFITLPDRVDNCMC